MDNNSNTESDINIKPDQLLQSENTAPSSPVLDTSNNKNKRTKVVLVIVIVLLILFAIGGLWWYLQGKGKDTAETAQQNSTAATSVEQEQQKTSVLDNYTVEETITDGGGVTIFYADTGRYISLPGIEGSGYYANLRVKTMTETGDYAITSVDELREYYENKFFSDGFERFVENDENLRMWDESTDQVRYRKDSVICTLEITGAENAYSFAVYKNCGDSAQASDIASSIEKFYIAYEQKLGDSLSDPYALSVDETKAIASAVEGYEYVMGGVGWYGFGAKVTFVRKDSGPWLFFAGQQDTIPCTEYAEEIYRNALIDTNCYDDSVSDPEKARKTVREYYNL